MKKVYLKSRYLAEGISEQIEGLNDEWEIFATLENGQVVDCKLYAAGWDTERFKWGVSTKWYQIGSITEHIWDGKIWGDPVECWVYWSELKKRIREQLEEDGFEVIKRRQA